MKKPTRRKYHTIGWQVCSEHGSPCKQFRTKAKAVAWFKRAKWKVAELVQNTYYESRYESKQDDFLRAVMTKQANGKVGWHYV